MFVIYGDALIYGKYYDVILSHFQLKSILVKFN